MTLDDVTTLEAQTNETLAKWWCELNAWDWPEGLSDEEPKTYSPNGRRGQIMNWISEKIGFKECLRHWNMETMPGVQFDDWFDNIMRPSVVPPNVKLRGAPLLARPSRTPC